MKILVAILSCWKHCHLWNRLYEKTKNIGGIIFVGGNDRTYYDKKRRILFLDCNDLYDGLPEKILYMHKEVLQNNEFKDVTHVLKIDDHDNDFNEGIIWALYSNEIIKNNDYIGQRVNYSNENNCRVWHHKKVPEWSYWYNRAYAGHMSNWADGGESYILSRKAMECIVEYFNKVGVEHIRENNIYEDVMIANILKDYNILPVQHRYGIRGDKDR